MSLRHINQFRFQNVSKREVFDHLIEQSNVSDFILGYDSNNETVIGEMFTPIRTRIRVPEARMLKLKNGVQGVWIMDRGVVDSEYIRSSDPMYMVKGTRYQPSDLTEETPGSLAETPSTAVYCEVSENAICSIVNGVTSALTLYHQQIEEQDQLIKSLRKDIEELKCQLSKHVHTLKPEVAAYLRGSAIRPGYEQYVNSTTLRTFSIDIQAKGVVLKIDNVFESSGITNTKFSFILKWTSSFGKGSRIVQTFVQHLKAQSCNKMVLEKWYELKTMKEGGFRTN